MSKRPTALTLQRLANALVADAHGLVIGGIEPRAVRDLLRAKGPRPELRLPWAALTWTRKTPPGGPNP